MFDEKHFNQLLKAEKVSTYYVKGEKIQLKCFVKVVTT